MMLTSLTWWELRSVCDDRQECRYPACTQKKHMISKEWQTRMRWSAIAEVIWWTIFNTENVVEFILYGQSPPARVGIERTEIVGHKLNFYEFMEENVVWHGTRTPVVWVTYLLTLSTSEMFVLYDAGWRFLPARRSSLYWGERHSENLGKKLPACKMINGDRQ